MRIYREISYNYRGFQLIDSRKLIRDGRKLNGHPNKYDVGIQTLILIENWIITNLFPRVPAQKRQSPYLTHSLCKRHRRHENAVNGLAQTLFSFIGKCSRSTIYWQNWTHFCRTFKHQRWKYRDWRSWKQLRGYGSPWESWSRVFD